MRQLVATLGVAFLGIGLLVGCGKGDGSKPASAGATTPGSGAGAKANLPTSAEIKGIGVCCAKCEQRVKEVLGKVDGVGDVTCVVKDRQVTFKAKDGAAAVQGWEAVRKAGFAGAFKHDDANDKSFQIVGPPLTLGKFDEITIKDVHVCCDGCEKAIKGVVKDAEVTFEGEGQQKTVKIKGKDLDFNAISGALWGAGYYGEPALPKGK